MTEKKSANPIDAHVGARMRLRRTMVGLSQEKLGDKLGVTFQQVQKYEKGTNRIGAGRLYDVSRILEVPVPFFYEDLPGDLSSSVTGMAESQSTYSIDILSSAEGHKLAVNFARVSDPKVRKKIVDLVKALAEAETSGSEDRN
jgi:transcriptional regulator with XRE-family HTH domain